MHIFSDLDGTLIQKRQIREMDIRKIATFVEADNKFSLASGRCYSTMKHLIGMVDAEFCICCNGAYIVDKNEQVIFKKTFDKEVFAKLLSIDYDGCQSGVSDGNDFIICNEIDSKSIKEPVFLNFTPFDKDVKKSYQIIEEIKKLGIYDELEISINGHHLDLGSAGTSKGLAVKYISDTYKIEKDDIIVVGDQKNDIAMFREFKNSFCIETGNEAALKAANNIVAYVGDIINHETFDILK